MSEGDPNLGLLVVQLSSRDADDALRLLSILATKPAADGDALTIDRRKLAWQAQRILARRSKRREFFSPAIFGEPAWEILLTLYLFEHRGDRLSVARAARLIGAPATSAKRWINYLEANRLVVRGRDDKDARSFILGLTEKCRTALDLYLALSGDADERLAGRGR